MILNLLQRVCKSLDANNIPYMISGSIALNIYTIPRMTRDIDIVVELTENRIDEFTSLFPDSYFNKAIIRDEIKRQGMFNILLIIKQDLKLISLFEKKQNILNKLLKTVSE